MNWSYKHLCLWISLMVLEVGVFGSNEGWLKKFVDPVPNKWIKVILVSVIVVQIIVNSLTELIVVHMIIT